MKYSRCRHILFSFLFVAALLAARPAAADLGFSAAVSTSSIVVSNTLTYTFNLTNATGFAISNIFLTNQFSIAIATNQSGWVTVNSNTIVLPVGTLLNATVLQTNWSGTPFFTGIRTNELSVTNTVTLVADGQANVTTNLETKIVIPKGDLGVSISVPTIAHPRVTFSFGSSPHSRHTLWIPCCCR